jgi:inhibitor of KinA
LEPEYEIFPLGDSAATLSLGNGIDESLNKKVLAMEEWIRQNRFYGLKDILVAYSSLTVIYDPVMIKMKFPGVSVIINLVKEYLEQAFSQSQVKESPEMELVSIPVCYEEPFAMDLENLSHEKQLSSEEIIAIHLAGTYRVYMIGFLPGFAYLASVDEKLFTPRKERPVSVHPGSVGIAGWQTGIYPFTSPGGWHIIGRTPLKLFDVRKDPPVLLKTGNHVRFFRISVGEFEARSKLYSLT